MPGSALERAFRHDRVVVLDQGRVVEEGAPQELIGRDGGVFRRFWETSRT